MEKIFEQIDNLFVNGVINGIISIVIAGIVLIAINKLLNKFIKKKWPDNYVLQKRIKKLRESDAGEPGTIRRNREEAEGYLFVRF